MAVEYEEKGTGAEDPGAEEGLSNEEKIGDKGGPPEGSQRWDKMYWQAKEGERVIKERDDLLATSKKDKEERTEMRRHNAALEKTLEGIQKVVDKPESGPDSIGEATKTLGNMEAKLTSLKTERSQARKDLDHDKGDRLDDDVMATTLDIREMKRAIDKKKNEPVKKEEPAPESEGLSDEDAAVYEKWLDNNSQIEENPRAIRYAQKMEKEVFGESEFKDSPIAEVLEEVTIRVYKKMDWNIEDKNKGGNKKQTPNLVESGVSSSSHSRGQEVKLSETELKLAKGFGVDPKIIAKQKLAITKEREVA